LSGLEELCELSDLVPEALGRVYLVLQLGFQGVDLNVIRFLNLEICLLVVVDGLK